MLRTIRTKSPSARIRAKRERRREQILGAALSAFRERGYHATTLDHIAEHLGVRKTALYHYFRDKEAILHACHRESLAELEGILSRALRIEDPRERLRHVIVEHVRVMTDTLDGSPLAFEVTSLAPDRQAEIIAGRDRYERELRRIIDRGVRAGAFRPVNSKVAVFAILGAINWVARWYRPDGALDAATIGDQFATHLVGGLGTAARSARPSHASRVATPRRRAGARVRAHRTEAS